MKATNVIKSIIFLYLIVIISCSPSLGASWYAKSSSSDSGMSMWVTSIKVMNKDVIINDPDLKVEEGDKNDHLAFAKAKRFSIALPYNCDVLDVDNLAILAYEDSKRQKPLKVSVNIEGDNVHLVPGEAVTMLLRIKDDKGRFKVEEKFISITREEPKSVDLVLESVEVLGRPVSMDKDGRTGTVDLPYSAGNMIFSGSISAKFKVGDKLKLLPVVIKNGDIALTEGESVEVACLVEEKKNEYNSYSFTITAKRLAKTVDEDEPLKIVYLGVLQRDAMSGLVKVPSDVVEIKAEDIVANFEEHGPLEVMLQEDVVKLDSAGTAELIIKVPAKKGVYAEWSKVVHVVREEEEGSDEPDPDEPEPSEPDPTDPEPPIEENPKDENGNTKFIIKTNVKIEEVDPFDYYKEDANGFGADKFNSWILNMTSIDTTHVASYAFKAGEWKEEDGVLTCTGDDIGKGQMNQTWNLKYYKYPNQEERWKGRWQPNLEDKEKERRKRFLFFRFTGNATGNALDNSMFCVDTHTKFLFYYSDPSDITFIFGNGIPSNWRDYEEPDEGKHKYSDKPFYLTDPIGYVKEDGVCVLYSWAKSHIRSSNYSASINPSYKKMASRKAGGYGYSPYKDLIRKEIKTKVKELNPLYTAKKPYITKQPKDIYLSLDKGITGVLELEVQEVPEGEELSYQWYKNDKPAVDENAVPIDGANKMAYEMPKEVIDTYCYCIVTNRNTENDKYAKTASHIVKVRIVQSEDDLKVDAETPYIVKHPKSAQLSILDGKAVRVSLSVEVKKPKDKGSLSYAWFKSENEDTKNGEKIEGATDSAYEFELSNAGIKYYYCVVTNKNDNATGKKEACATSLPAKIEVEELFLLSCNFVGKGMLTIFGSEEGKVVLQQEGERQLRVKAGLDLVFIAKPAPGYVIQKWEPASMVEPDNKEPVQQMKINNKDDVKDTVMVYFEEIPKRGEISLNDITIKNVSMKGSKKYIYVAYDIAVHYKDDESSQKPDNVNGYLELSRWNAPENKIDYNNDALYAQGLGASTTSIPPDLTKAQNISFYNTDPQLKLSCALIKLDVNWANTHSNHQIISELENGDIEFEYDKEKDYWKVKTKKNEVQTVDKVTVEFDENFILPRGLEKQFKVSYTVDNPKTKTEGTIEVIYQLSWK